MLHPKFILSIPEPQWHGYDVTIKLWMLQLTPADVAWLTAQKITF